MENKQLNFLEKLGLLNVNENNSSWVIEPHEKYEPFFNIYGKGVKIKPYRRLKEKCLPEILPLEDYDKILLGFSGGKDSVALCLYLLNMGVPKDKIILLHHCIDGAENSNTRLKMDWACTRDYCSKFAEAMGITIKYSWREDGFIGEILRLGASKPIVFEELSSEKITTTDTDSWKQTLELSRQLKIAESTNDTELIEELMVKIKSLGYRFKFPAKTASLATRWCSSALKIEVCDRILRYAEDTFQDCKILFVDGIRREESPARNKYNEMESHRCSAVSKKNRLVHHWRPIIEWTEEQVWDILKKYSINPHPCYKLGWSRCSCAMCIFSLPEHFKGIKEILPERFQEIVDLEKELGFTLDNKKSIEEYIKDAKSCVLNKDENLISYVRSGELPSDYIICNEWELPVGAYHCSEGGPC